LLSPHNTTQVLYTFVIIDDQCNAEKNEKKALREMQTLRRAKKFRPAADPSLGAQDGQNLISWSWYLYLQTQFGED